MTHRQPASRKHTGLSTEDKRLFRAAMVYFGYTRETWSKFHGISLGYFDQIRGGFQRNERVLDQVRDTIRQFRQAVALEHTELTKPRKTRVA